MEVNFNIRVTLDASPELLKVVMAGLAALATPAIPPRGITPNPEPPKQTVPKAVQPKTVPSQPTPRKKAETAATDAPTKISEEEAVALRKAIAAYAHADPTNATRVKSWMNEHGVARVSDCTTADAAKLMAFIGAGGAVK